MLFLIYQCFVGDFELFIRLRDRTYQRVGTKLFDLLPFLAILSLKSLSRSATSWFGPLNARRSKDIFLKMLKFVTNQDLSRISECLFDSLGSLTKARGWKWIIWEESMDAIRVHRGCFLQVFCFVPIFKRGCAVFPRFFGGGQGKVVI